MRRSITLSLVALVCGCSLPEYAELETDDGVLLAKVVEELDETALIDTGPAKFELEYDLIDSSSSLRRGEWAFSAGKACLIAGDRERAKLLLMLAHNDRDLKVARRAREILALMEEGKTLRGPKPKPEPAKPAPAEPKPAKPKPAPKPVDAPIAELKTLAFGATPAEARKALGAPSGAKDNEVFYASKGLKLRFAENALVSVTVYFTRVYGVPGKWATYGGECMGLKRGHVFADVLRILGDYRNHPDTYLRYTENGYALHVDFVGWSAMKLHSVRISPAR